MWWWTHGALTFPAEWAAGGTAFTLLGFAAFLTWRLIRLLNAQIDRDASLHAANDRCQHRLSILVRIAIEHGWEFPEGFWEDHDDHQSISGEGH